MSNLKAAGGVGVVAVLVVACGGKTTDTTSSSGGGGMTGQSSSAITASSSSGRASSGPSVTTTASAATSTSGSTGAGGSGVGGGNSGAPSGPCPTSGAGSIQTPGAACFAFTPEVTGASSAGENAGYHNYAIAPDSGQNGKLVLFINGTMAHPSDSIASPTKNFYNAAAQLGYHVLAVSYRSNETIAEQCTCADACYFPSRQTVITGTVASGAAPGLSAPLMRVDESIAGRAALALRWLVANDASHDWSAYLTQAAPSAPPDQQIDWGSVVVAGHSQGGGHAAAIGKLYPVARVVQLSAACDTIFPSAADCSHQTDPSLGSPASWTARSDGTWETGASAYWGLDLKTVFDGGAWVSGDGACFEHLAIWQNEQVPATNQNDEGAVCGATTITENHDASIDCEENFANWQAMLK